GRVPREALHRRVARAKSPRSPRSLDLLAGVGLRDDPVDLPAPAFAHHVVHRLDVLAVRAADLDHEIDVAVRPRLRGDDVGTRGIRDLRVAGLDHALERLAI